ncbi:MULTISPECIES: tetratricopeptide repeat protein [Mycobacterium]|uniref:tetratricopeptide repeat protein n=1 Tax=Mycobacterium TaxID=1763 RepID=UPI00351CD9CB
MTADAEDSALDDYVAEEDTNDVEPPAFSGRPFRRRRHPVAFGVVAVVALSLLVGWLGWQNWQARHAQQARARYLQTARQAALNLTTIDWQHVDADVRRIMDNSTGEFQDEFAQRSAPFIEVVKQAKSSSVGTVTEAAMESQTAEAAKVIVAASVKTSDANGTEPVPRAWRMRISIQRIGDQFKISRVEFVP